MIEIKIFKLIRSLQDNLRITSSQSMFILAVYCKDYTLDISNEDYRGLISRGLLKDSILTTLAIKEIDKILGKDLEKSEKNSDIKYPNLTKKSGDIVKGLAAIFAQKIPAAEMEKLSLYFKGNHVMWPFMYLFFQMFPSSDDDKNKVWDNHFQTDYQNVTLRRVTRGTARKLEQIWSSKKDFGVFLFGTYMYMKGARNVSNNNYYVMKIENYLRDYETYYQEAEEVLNSSQSALGITSAQKSNTIVL